MLPVKAPLIRPRQIHLRHGDPHRPPLGAGPRHQRVDSARSLQTTQGQFVRLGKMNSQLTTPGEWCMFRLG